MKKNAAKASRKTISTKERVQVTLTFLTIVALVLSGLYLVAVSSEQGKAKRLTAFGKGYGYGRGIITSLHSYKGQNIRVRYKINGTDYEHDSAWDYNPKHLGEADSIGFKYAVSDPSFIITELENDYQQ